MTLASCLVVAVLGATEPAPETPPWDAWSVEALRTERKRLLDERPSFAGPIWLVAGAGVATYVGSLVVGPLGSTVSSVVLVVGLVLGGVTVVAAAVWLVRLVLEHRRVSRAVRAIDAELQRRVSTPPLAPAPPPRLLLASF